MALAAASMSASSAQAGPCDGDVNGDGALTPDDLRCVTDGISDPTLCPGGDINSDGVIDFCDHAAMECLLNGGGPACCAEPCGACCAFCKVLDGSGVAGNICRQTTATGCANGIIPGPVGQGIFCQPGDYHGDGVPCLPSPCDCNGNGVPDGQDVDPADPDGNGQVSSDCDNNGIPDECQFPDPNTIGACCVPGQGCANGTPAECSAAGGIFSGFCTSCDVQNIAIILEPSGEVFIHVVGPQDGGDCTNPVPEGPCPPGPSIDAWQSPPAAMMCHNFGAAGVTPIPADFFLPGSDPFTGTICLQGVPLGDPNFPGADTLIQRSADPFDRCELPSPTPQTVDIEIVALSLVSTQPITVTFNGGMNPEPWDVKVDLSSVPSPPGQLSAIKEHCNGGTYTSILPVQPRFTFTQINPPNNSSVWDTGLIGPPDPPLQLQQTIPAPWVHDVAPQLGLVIDPCSDFHAGISEANPKFSCDCNGNGIRDKCDIEAGAPDTNSDGVPDTCQAGPIPTASEWGLMIMAILLLTGGTVVFRRRRAVTQ